MQVLGSVAALELVGSPEIGCLALPVRLPRVVPSVELDVVKVDLAITVADRGEDDDARIEFWS